jgi:hypothetical protein
MYSSIRLCCVEGKPFFCLEGGSAIGIELGVFG